ncbi:DeoR/GlpR family DNA-binding transcription regulator [Clavibacter sepedonicus]|uniref:DeoR/GlpR family DNA-binding transcription regulator n=1 Tax=Clavibacter TaxID=1573 RepID=UPI000318430A|nr:MULTISPECIES: DeoR/GlpR family DNA-binding transcription regulator [Clavibacter]MBD5381840.1 DeoR/GlpR transcriptional regulator [Clavibacter sp.]OQJ47558.1 D-beta-D-heptose 1-phosphate adenosyltransferase [Clavibacter sepedonicus]OQJ53114.1 D-beta-D-heptose 1-phosphate adenosyltransferase [Clavibacter sepedonicus]UUK64269.1 DeoR/GlpR family DNA-binding transcription regulator [Clavibacter sepedonicus]
MYAEERQDRVVALLERTGRVAVVGLARDFDVTTETVRRDLAQLESRGVLRRVHGGAVLAGRSTRAEESLDTRGSRNTAAKARIADAAMAFLPASFEGSIALDAGTTTGLVAERVAAWRPDVPGRTLVVVTHSMAVAQTVTRNPAVEVQLLGGRVRGITSAAVGPATLGQLARLRPDIAFIGANGIHAEFGLSTPDEEEAAVKTALTRGSRRAVALVDASKAGEEALVGFAALGDLDTLVTDAAPDGPLADALAAAEVEVMVA